MSERPNTLGLNELSMCWKGKYSEKEMEKETVIEFMCI